MYTGSTHRDNKEMQMPPVTQEIADYPATDLAPGDLIVLNTGDKVPADCRLVKYYNRRRSLSVDETCPTGESVAVEKLVGIEGLAEPDLVVKTGPATEFGTIQSGVFQAKEDAHDTKTPLAHQLDGFGDQLTKLIGGCLCARVVGIHSQNVL